MKHKVYTTSFPGIGPITGQEIQQKLNTSIDRSFSTKQYDINTFIAPAKLNQISQLRTVEDIFLLINIIDLVGTREDLKKIKNFIGQFNFYPLLSVHRSWQTKRLHRPTWRVIAQSNNPPWQKYRRKDLQKAVELGISHQFPGWKNVSDRATIEFWIQTFEHSAIIGLRLTDKHTRHRDYKQSNLPGSLRPTIAASLVFLSQPHPNETVLDPFCGVGTILIERALSAPHQLLIGSDISPKAIQAARINFGRQHQPWELNQWDITQIPLTDRSIDKIITNPPWDIKIKSQPNLIPDFFRETHRVLKPDGQIILITSQPELYLSNLANRFHLRQKHPHILVLGQPATILIMEKIC